MSGIQIQVDTRGLHKKMLVAGQVFNPHALLKAIGLRHLGWITKNFDSSGSLVGGWAPLSPATIARKGSSGILVDTGRLKQSFSRESPKVRTNEVWVGTNVVYAAPHQWGWPERGIPQRRMLPTKEEAEKLAVSVIEGAIKKIDKAGI